ncbi:hypothetical protein COLO4_00218 [Corchorus olitorius]|uniref:UDP-glucuronosyl/UDP-glucosyltransferase n=1 Tax=Corchorus olitorius TaxID=93759 RepID=A0A1R3L4D1_9ROSI|nr:hypothetical protein COLO4_00218 [Corchorus olitorius]
MDAEVKSGKVGHIICLPLPAQGHFKPLLKLAELLSEAKANDEDLDKPFTQIPGFENDFRYRDLPSGCRIANFNKTTANLFLSDQFKSASQTSALIINTFDGLEAPTISKLTSYYSKIFTVGLGHYYTVDEHECH